MRLGSYRFNRPECDPIDIAYGYLFLSSDEVRQITAANLPIDGGCAGAVTGGMQGEIEQ